MEKKMIKFKRFFQPYLQTSNFFILSVTLIVLVESIHRQEYILISLSITYFILMIIKNILLVTKKHFYNKVKYFFETVNLIYCSIVAAKYVDLSLHHRNYQLLLEGLKIGLFESCFLFISENILLQIFNAWILTFILAWKLDINSEDVSFLVLTNIFFIKFLIISKYQETLKKKFKKLVHKKYNSNLNVTNINQPKCNPSEIDSNDLTIVMNKDSIILYTSNNFSSYLAKLKPKYIGQPMKIFSKGKYKLLKSLKSVKAEDIYFNIYSNLNLYNENFHPNKTVDDLGWITFESLIEKVLATSTGQPTFWATIASLKTEQKNELMIIIYDQDLVTIKIKRDFCYKEMIKYKLQLENYQKVISFLAHEFRTPLNCIINMIQALEEYVSVELVNNYISPSIISTNFLLNLVNDLVDIAQIQAGTFKIVPVTFNLENLLNDTIQIIVLQAKKRNLELKIENRISKKEIRNDPNRIRQILINLLSKKKNVKIII